MAIKLAINALNAGELSPYLSGRVDVAKYASGCKTLRNMLPMTYGGVRKRRGFEYIAAAKHADKPCRLVRFQFAVGDIFMLEFGEQYVRFFQNGAMLATTDGGSTPYEVATPYTAAEVFELQWVQSLDVIYLVHPNHPPCKLSRYGLRDWRFAQVDFNTPAFLDLNDTDTTIALFDDTLNSRWVLQASEDVFQAGHVGSYWAIEHARDDISTSGGFGTSAGVRVKGNWYLGTSGTWSGTVSVERSYDRDAAGSDAAATWEHYRTYSGASDRNLDVSGNEKEECFLRIVTSFSSGDFAYDLNIDEYYRKGIFKITEVIDSQNAVVDVVQAPYKNDATKRWYEGAWNAVRGYPRAVTFYQQRLFFAGSGYEPQSVWGSQIDDYENFELGSLDTDAMKYTFSSEENNAILWMSALEEIAVGTTGGEWRVGSTDLKEAITPSNVRIVRQSTYGSGDVGPEVVNDRILFAQRGNRRIRELQYSFEKDGYIAPDITLLAEHITGAGVVDMAYQRHPESVLWCVREDGTLAAMTYDTDQNVAAWARHDTQGKFLSVETMASTVGDELWAAVERELPSGKVVYIERMQNENTQANVYLTADAGYASSVPGKIQLAFLVDRNETFGGYGHGIASMFGEPTYEQIFGALEAAYPGKVEYALVSFREQTAQIKVETDFTDLNGFYAALDAVEVSNEEGPGDGFIAIDTARGLAWDLKKSCLRMLVLRDWCGADGINAEEDISAALSALNDMKAHGHYIYDIYNTDMPIYASVLRAIIVGPDGENSLKHAADASIVQENEGKPNGGFYNVFVAREVDYLDSALWYRGTTVSEVSGLAHLEGMTVGVVANGGYEGTRTVKDGKISLSTPAYDVRVGLPYTAEVETMSIEYVGNGTTQGMKRNIKQAVARLYRSGNCKIGASGGELQKIYMRGTADAMDAPAPLFTGLKEVAFPGSSDREKSIRVVSDTPEPLTVLAVIAEVDA